MRIGYLECFSGISGDMMLGALVDAGVPLSVLKETVAALNVGARLETQRVMRGGLAATKVDVIAPEHSAATQEHTPDHDRASHSHDHHVHHDHDASHKHSHGDHEHSHAPHRSLSSILAVIRSAPLAERVKERAVRAFQLLGEAEAAIHSIPIEKVHFHEVGAVDTIADIVCSAAGCEALGVDRWLCSPLNVGSGTVNCAHGTLPVPAPATLALLADAPVYSAGEPLERVTPTGAAILRMLNVRYGSLPAIRVQSRGYGAGSRDTPGTPNLLRILVGEEADDILESAGGEPIAVIEATIDDSSPQLIGYASDLLLAAGAWDVYRQPVQMKKGRTGVQLTVLCRPDLLPALRELLFRETTTIGLRWRFENKLALARELAEVETRWGKVRIKIARWPSGQVANAAPEYEDCRGLAKQHSVPLKQVMQEALRIYGSAQAAVTGART
jgi:pyridinium-3,5-bisthiocarboxylic acid mononucleotide nickel chelatase